MRALKLSLPLTLIGSVLLLSGVRNAHTRSVPNPEKHETAAAVHPDSTNQDNQAALYAALIGALHAITHQEEAAAEQTRAENESWLTPLRIQEGLLVVGIVYSFFAWKQWVAIDKQAEIANKTLIETGKAADAAKRSADAAIAVSAAHVHVMRVHLSGLEALDATGVADPVLGYGYTNYGKSPAMMLEACWERHFGLRLPEQPSYSNRGPLFELLIIPAEKDVDFGQKWSHIFGNYLTNDDFDPIRKMQHKLFVYGYIRYRDVFEQAYAVGFAYWIDVKGQAHVVTPEVAPTYIYRRKE